MASASAGLADIVRDYDENGQQSKRSNRAQLAAGLQRADASLESNIATPLRRESEALAAVQHRIVDGTERLARDVQAVIAGMERSAKSVDGFLLQYKKLDRFDEWLQASAKRSERVVSKLQEAHLLLQS